MSERNPTPDLSSALALFQVLDVLLAAAYARPVFNHDGTIKISEGIRAERAEQEKGNGAPAKA